MMLTTRLITLSRTITFIPFHSIVAFWISSPTFLGDYYYSRSINGYSNIIIREAVVVSLTKPRGPNLGARAEAEPISPPTAFNITEVRFTYYH